MPHGNSAFNLVQIPTFAEAHHESILALEHYTDAELIQSHIQEPEKAQFFIAFFCRYSSIVYSIIQHVAGDQLQIDYVFALAWQRVFDRLQELDDRQIDKIVWQQWVVMVAGELVGPQKLPPSNEITYRLAVTSPPLRCYTTRSLELIQPLLRLVFIMGNQWHWSAAQISTALQAEGEDLAEMDVPLYLAEAQKSFEKTLPLDLLEIYGSSSNH
jgi:hypothetical protein